MLALNSSKLIKLIESINADLRIKVPEVNEGGCAIFASLMYKELKALGYNPTINILHDSWSKDINRNKVTLNKVINKEKVASYDKRSTSFNHCCLEVEGVYFDGIFSGSHPIDFYPDGIQGFYSIQELDTAIKVAGWNSTYNRRRKNPTLRASINRAVKQVYNTKVC